MGSDPSYYDTLRSLPEQTETSGIAPEWVRWSLQWHRFSDLAPSVKRQYFHILLRAGRWQAALHPEITSPHQWTSKLAAEYVAAVAQMKVGDFCTATYRSRMQAKIGFPWPPTPKKGSWLRCGLSSVISRMTLTMSRGDLTHSALSALPTRLRNKLDPTHAISIHFSGPSYAALNFATICCEITLSHTHILIQLGFCH